MNINQIEKEKRCMRCGMCCGICPVGAILRTYCEKDGFYHMQVDESKCVQCGKCLQVCPANHFDSNIHPLGAYQKILLAHSNDRSVRNQCTSGGVVNELARFLLARELVDGVVMTGYSSSSPIEAETLLLTRENCDQLKTAPREYASRYVSVPVLSSIKKMMKSAGRLAVVGTPCQIRALHLEGNACMDIFKIGIACSGGMSYRATAQYKKSMGMDTSKMYYRGNGWPGSNTLVDEERKIDFQHLGSLFERMFSSQIFKNPGCRFCTDHFAECADVSFCDFWSPEEVKTESNGNSCVIVRTQKAAAIIEEMISKRFITEVRTPTECETIQTQLTALKTKKTNIHDMKKYKRFVKVVDFLFEKELYKHFTSGIYRKIALYYARILDDIQYP